MMRSEEECELVSETMNERSKYFTGSLGYMSPMEYRQRLELVAGLVQEIVCTPPPSHMGNQLVFIDAIKSFRSRIAYSFCEGVQLEIMWVMAASSLV